MPDSSVASRSAAASSVPSPGSQWPPMGSHIPALGCSVSSTRSPSWDSTAVVAVRWPGTHCAPHRVVVRVQMLEELRCAAPPPRRSARSTPRARSARRRAGSRAVALAAATLAVAVLAAFVVLARSVEGSCRGASRNDRSSSGSPRTKPSGSSRSSAVGSRSGWAHSASRPSTPARPLSACHSAGRLAQPARAQLQADQRGEGLLGRAAGRPAAAYGLASAAADGQLALGGAVHHRADPALDQREQVSSRARAAFCRSVSSGWSRCRRSAPPGAARGC